jgi:hypothetical protein
MKKSSIGVIGLILALIAPGLAQAEDDTSPGNLTARWVEWALSIPTSVNPQLDATGANCMVGQRGSIWFLAGVFGGFGRGTATRACSVPADKALFFPVANDFEINSPNVCPPGSPPQTVAQLRTTAAGVVNGVTKKSVTVDGQVPNVVRIPSTVFAVALPGDNVFNALCGGPGSVPAAIYSPAVADGFYVRLEPLPVGTTLFTCLRAEVSSKT